MTFVQETPWSTPSMDRGSINPTNCGDWTGCAIGSARWTSNSAEVLQCQDLPLHGSCIVGSKRHEHLPKWGLDWAVQDPLAAALVPYPTVRHIVA